MLNKNIIKSILFLLLCGVIFYLNPMPASAQFSDIKGHWAEEDIIKAYSYEFIKGFPSGEFEPESELTRAQLAVVLLKLFPFDVENINSPKAVYNDYREDQWYSQAAAVFAKYEIYPAGTFRADEPINRIDVAQAISNCFDALAYEVPNYNISELLLSDIPEDIRSLSLEAKTDYFLLSDLGLMKGYDGRFYPQDKLSRAQAAAVFNRCYEYLQEKEVDDIMIGADKMPVEVKEWALEVREEAGLHKKNFEQIDAYIIAMGMKPTGGYQVIVDLIAFDIEKQKWTVNYSFREPQPDEMVTMALTYPYEIIAVPAGTVVEFISI